MKTELREIAIAVPVQDHPENICPMGEPTNEVRAGRVSTLLSVRAAIMGEEFDPESAASDETEVACLLADIRHWCDQNGVDFFAAEKLSYQHYLAERASRKESH